MGEFTQNLLKLTEFPFSYSFIGLLALIFGHGTNLENLSFTEIGPLLILIGFVATTLSICDPAGAIQRRIIKGRELSALNKEGENYVTLHLWQFHTFDNIINASVFGNLIWFHFPWPYILVIQYTPENVIKRYNNIDWDIVQQGIQGETRGKTVLSNELDKIDKDDVTKISHLFEGLKDQTVKTKWITAEIDRITALIYFIAVISLFIAATQLYPDFLQKFAQVFENNEWTRLGILIFSIVALVAVVTMLILRTLGLLDKASTVFRYLTALEAIKTGKENFRTTLEEIERYLNDNDWTLSKYWVEHIQIEYSEYFFEKVKELKKSRLEKEKDQGLKGSVMSPSPNPIWPWIL